VRPQHIQQVTNTTGHCGSTFDVTRTWRATDACGNTADCSQKVTVEDHTPPTITCAGNKIVECGKSWSFDPPTASDTCGSATLSILNTVTNTTGHCGSTFDVTRTGAPPTPAAHRRLQSKGHRGRSYPADHHCVGNKIVECGSPWSFDPPTPATTCGSAIISILNTVTNTTGHCGSHLRRDPHLGAHRRLRQHRRVRAEHKACGTLRLDVDVSA